MSSPYICWVLSEDGYWPVVELKLVPMFGGAKATLADGRGLVTNRDNLLSPETLYEKFDWRAWAKVGSK